ncbi:MAG: hypothetical protein ISQ06_05475 [Planctomycetaceae bacterium]|jgi:hypothetical protein|nr:hypothetical protein [Planctomycetaceae bacterium]
MPDSTSNEFASPSEVVSRAAGRHAERERLIDDLAFLVVRQHHHNQRAEMTDVPAKDAPMLNPNEKRGK